LRRGEVTGRGEGREGVEGGSKNHSPSDEMRKYNEFPSERPGSLTFIFIENAVFINIEIFGDSSNIYQFIIRYHDS